MTKEQVAQELSKKYTIDGDYYTRGRVMVRLMEDCMSIMQGSRMDIVYYDEEGDIERVLELLTG